MEIETYPMKTSKHRTYSKALLIIILTAAFSYFNPGDARGYMPSVMNQSCALILNAVTHQNLSFHLRKDLYIAKDSESADDNDDNDKDDDNEDDDDWEAC